MKLTEKKKLYLTLKRLSYGEEIARRVRLSLVSELETPPAATGSFSSRVLAFTGGADFCTSARSIEGAAEKLYQTLKSLPNGEDIARGAYEYLLGRLRQKTKAPPAVSGRRDVYRFEDYQRGGAA